MRKFGRIVRGLASAMLTIPLTAGALPASAGTAAPPQLTSERPCPELPGFTCSYLTVPLDRSGKVPGELRLQVASADNARAPKGVLLFLTGGPGQPGVSYAKTVRQKLAGLMDDYRLVMIDQRGTGQPALDCPELQKETGSSDLTPPSAAAVRACAAALGDRRDYFTTAETVADLDALRSALGAGSWTLDGVSYGTLTAQTYALTHPRRVRKLVLDSVVTQDNADPLYVDGMRHAASMLRTACREQSCGFDPARALARVVRRHGDEVRIFDVLVALSVIDPKLDGKSGPPPFLPVLRSAARGDTKPLSRFVDGFYSGPPVPPADFSSGLHVATLCGDLSNLPWGDTSAPLAGRDAALRKAVRRIKPRDAWPFRRTLAGKHGLVLGCLYWPPARSMPAPPYERITAPTLLLAGDRDLSTPPVWARHQAARIPGSRLVVIPGAGHSTQVRGPGAEHVERFLR